MHHQLVYYARLLIIKYPLYYFGRLYYFYKEKKLPSIDAIAREMAMSESSKNGTIKSVRESICKITCHWNGHAKDNPLQNQMIVNHLDGGVSMIPALKYLNPTSWRLLTPRVSQLPYRRFRKTGSWKAGRWNDASYGIDILLILYRIADKISFTWKLFAILYPIAVILLTGWLPGFFVFSGGSFMHVF